FAEAHWATMIGRGRQRVNARCGPRNGSPITFQVRHTSCGPQFKWIRLGETIIAVYGRGAGLLHNFGFSDAAPVRLEHPAAHVSLCVRRADPARIQYRLSCSLILSLPS